MPSLTEWRVPPANQPRPGDYGFDLDKTLIRRNSATLWIRHEFAAGRITRIQAVRAAFWVVRYSLGAADMSEPIRRTVASLAATASISAERRFSPRMRRP